MLHCNNQCELDMNSILPARSETRLLSLALQGGGAHGAFSWGVLDALLEDGRIAFDGISAASAGAMNAVALAHGYLCGGRDGAREALARYWRGVADIAPAESLANINDEGELSASLRMAIKLTRWFSPYQLNPLGINPLRELIEKQFDFERLRSECPFKLFIAATHANSGRLRLFQNRELSADALLASACLPTVHQAVSIDGEPYWDGAFAANPAVFPLFSFCECDDILLVMLAPLEHERTPRRAGEIQERMTELAFNSAFLREMRIFALMQEAASGSVQPLGGLEKRLSATRFHLVDSQPVLARLASASKLVAHLSFLESLRDAGREQTQLWLAEHFDAIGRRATADIAKLFF